MLVGAAHSGVAMAVAKAAKDSDTTLIVPNAGALAVTGPMCAMDIFPSSFGHWQPGFEDCAGAGLKKAIPLYGSGFLTDVTPEAQGAGADGVETTLHNGDALNTPRASTFRLACAKACKLQPDVHAVQGDDAAQMLGIGLAAVNGDIGKKAEFAEALRKATIDSPRGKLTMLQAHNPVQDIWLRKVADKENKVSGVASKALNDPGRGCRM